MADARSVAVDCVCEDASHIGRIVCAELHVEQRQT